MGPWKFHGNLRVIHQLINMCTGDKRPELAILGTDYIFTCPLRNMMVNYAAKSGQPAYYYEVIA
jgi:hypothetical protein